MIDPEKLVGTFTVMSNDSSVYVALVRGKRVKMSNGKSAWVTKGAAKNAVINHLKKYLYGMHQGRKEFMQAWIKQNVQVLTESEWSALAPKS